MPAYYPLSRAEKAAGALQDAKLQVVNDVSTANLVPEQLEPNKDDVAAHFYKLFDPALAQLYPDAWIEIAYSDPAANGLDSAEIFSVFQLKEATEFATKKNGSGYNVYVGPALRQGDRPSTGRAKDEHVVAAAYAWVDFDGAGDAERIQDILKERNLRPALVITTGTVPHLRCHLYFKLDGTVTPEQLRAVNTSLMTLLGSDAVQNPSRPMRLAGTVSYPSKKKTERGYIAELVALRTLPDAPEYRADYLIGLAGGTPGAASNDTNAGEKTPKTDHELLELLRVSRGTSKWHIALRDVTASMVGRGWQDLAIKLSCAPYCDRGANDPELDALIQSARKKFDKPDSPARRGRKPRGRS